MMMKRKLFRRPLWTGLAVPIACLLLNPSALDSSYAHGFAGSRFFPATIATDDPFVSDELSLPTVTTFRTRARDGEPSARETDIGIDYTKRITPRLGLSAGEDYTILSPQGEPTRGGFGNLDLGLKYQFYESDEHETILSAGLDASVGGTGRAVVGADLFSTLTPTFYFGKGLGDLPDSLSYLKPMAVTGVLGLAIPTEARADGERNPNTLEWGFALEYNLQYLQSQVKDIGLRTPFDHFIPLIEFAQETPLDRGQAGLNTGTVNPGLIWFGNKFQIGVEAIIPVNNRTGQDIGVVAQLHFFLDDVFPHTLGRPLFGSSKP